MPPEQERACHHQIILATKVLSVIACLIACIFNSYVIFTQFIGKKTITSENVENNDRLLLPSFTICSLSGYKEEMDEYDDLVLENYLNKTLNLEELLYGYYDDEDFVNLDTMKADTLSWQFTTTYSQYKGRCHTLTYKKQVNSRDNLALLLAGETEFWLYIHDVGEEFFLHYDFWPIVPRIYHVRKTEVSLDLVIKKMTEVTDDYCISKEYSYFECLRSEFIQEAENLDEKCTLPWIQSMKGVFDYTEKSSPTCNTVNGYSVVDEHGLNFSAMASAYNHSKCLANCQMSFYDVGVQTYDRFSFVSIKEPADKFVNTTEKEENATGLDDPTYRYLNIYYGSTNVKVYTTSLKIDINTFISNVGGNLGLFVGFSVLGGLFSIYDFISQHISMNV